MYDSVVIVNGFPSMTAANFRQTNIMQNVTAYKDDIKLSYHFLGLNVSNRLHYFIVYRVLEGG